MRKGLILWLFAMLVLSSIVVADGDMMGGYGMMSGMLGGGWMLGGFLGLVYFAVVSFVFSIIFWWTYKWIVKEKKK